MFVEEQSRPNIFVKSVATFYPNTGSPEVTTGVHEGNGLSTVPPLNLGDTGLFAEKRDDGSGGVYETYIELTLSNECDVVPMSWSLTIRLFDRTTWTNTYRTDVVTLSGTTSYTLRCTAMEQECYVDGEVFTIPV
jgi:hypothetical protein